MLVNNYQSFQLNNCVVRDNQAFHGGGLYSWDTDSIMIHNSLFTGNTCIKHGGGMRIGGSGSFFKISNSIVRYNSTGTLMVEESS